MTKTITIAHSPDSDDAFMFYAIACKRIAHPELEIKQVMKDIQTLNLEAIKQSYDVTAISFAAYPDIAENYMLMNCGASFGINYGPVLIARPEFSVANLSEARVAIPGKQTSAYLALQLYQQNLKVVEHPFEKIIAGVQIGEFDAGLLIHEGQLIYQKLGLKKIIDLGQWWHDHTGLPLPLGANAIKRDLGNKMISEVSQLMKDAISYALDHRKDALKYAQTFAPTMSAGSLDKYVSMYVNELSVDYGEQGKKSIRLFFDEAYQKRLIKTPVMLDFAPAVQIAG